MLALTKKFLVRTLALGLVMAMVGFCYATSSGGRSIDGKEGAGVSAAGRAVGTTPLRFTNVLLRDQPYPQPDTYDLGDAAYGSMTTRYVTVTGGVRPYSFGQTGLAVPVLAVNSSIALNASGYLIGSVVAGTVSPLTFGVTATDSFGTTPNAVQGIFQLTLVVPPANMFRFGTDRINNGVVGLSYAAKLDALNGYGTVQYSVLPSTLAVNGVPKGTSGSLEAIGLSLASDGTISGRPLEAGRITFTARAMDSAKRIARDRTDTVQDQLASFNVEQNSTTSTDYTTLACHAQGDVGQFNKDSISFSGVINVSGVNFNSLDKTRFEFRLGGASYSGFLTFRGRVVNEHGGAAVFADGSRFKASLNPRTGQIKGTVTKTSLGKLLDGINVADHSTRRYALQLIVAKYVVASDMLEFATRRKGDKFTVDYKAGTLGQPLGGQFQILSVKGRDSVTVAGDPGVMWAVKFLAAPRFGVDVNPGLDAVSRADVRIGNRFEHDILAKYLTSTNNGTTQLIKNNYKGELVSKLSFSARKFTGSLLTQPLSEYATGLTVTKVAKNPTNFTLGLDIIRSGNNASFSGENSKVIVPLPKGRTWTDSAKPLAR